MARKRPGPAPVTRVDRPDPMAQARLWMLLAVLVAVPLAFDPAHNDAFSTVKLVVLAAGVAACAAAMVVHWAVAGRVPLWRSPLHLAAAGLFAWTVVATVASVNPHYSVLGRYGTYDGMVSAALGLVLFVVVADTVTLADLRRVATVVYFGAGGPVVFYALLQLHDSAVSSGGGWDTVQWRWFAFPKSWIWSTFGNPNHLAAFLVVLLPLGLVLFFVHQDRRVRGATAAMLVAILVELLYTGARGAWVAAGVAVLALGGLLARDLRAGAGRRLGPAVGAGIAGLALLGGLSVATGLTPTLWSETASIFSPHGRTTIERTEMWRTAWRMGTDRPLVGVGPDMYETLFSRYQSARWAREFSPTASPNGPHSVFFSHLAAGGFPELALFVAVLAVAARQARRSVRGLARREEAQKQRPAREQVREQRLLLSAWTAALVAFVVQATFNAQMIDLSFWLWALLGIVAGAGAGVALDEPAPDGRASRLGAVSPSRPPRPALAVPVAVVAVAGALVAAWLGARPYRADGRVTEARARGSVALSLAGQQLDRARGEAVAVGDLYDQAFALNPREADFRVSDAWFQFDFGKLELAAADPSVRAEGIERLRTARHLFRQALRLQPYDPGFLRDYAKMLAGITKAAAPTLDHSTEARQALRAAQRANPRDDSLETLLADIAAGRDPTQDPPAEP